MISRTTYQVYNHSTDLVTSPIMGHYEGQGSKVSYTCDTFKQSGAMTFKSTHCL